METYIYIFIPPIVGGLIGWFTNAIAIWMLFHPYERRYLFGFSLPFTPGLIPSRIEELADSIAKIIARYLLTREDWIQLIDSMELDEKAVDEIFSKIKSVTGSHLFKMPFFSKLKHVVKETIRKELRRAIRKRLKNIILRATEQKQIEDSIEKLIQQKIVEEFDPEKIERIVRQVCKKELNYIMLFGGILGVIIGFIQALLFL